MSFSELIDTNDRDEEPSHKFLTDDSLIEMANNAERRIAAVKKIKTLSLAVTTAQDWQDEGGKPYLWVSGAEKIARLFNISWRIDEPEVEDHDDGHFTYHFKGFFKFSNNEIEAIGSRSSRDNFFSKAHGRALDPGTINRGNVKKAAYTNCIGNGVTRLLGIRNLTWQELAHAGIVQGQSQAIDRSGVPKAPNWGKFPKQPLSEVNDEWLTKYFDTAEKQIADPKRADFLDMNTKLLGQLNAELDRRADQAVKQGGI